MPLLNYTTSIDYFKTTGEIRKCLASHGAKDINEKYDDDGDPVAMEFSIKYQDKIIGFRLPCDWKPVLKILEKDRKVPRRLKNGDQALRVAWRIVKDWIEAQMAILETEMVSMAEIFLPYHIVRDDDGNQVTLFKKFDSSQKLLESGD